MRVSHHLKKSFTKIDVLEGADGVFNRFPNEGYLVVFDQGRYVGILTPGSLSSFGKALVGDCIQTIPTVGPDEGLDSALKLMLSPGIPALPVVENGAFLGVLCFADVVRALVAEGDAIESIVDKVESSLTVGSLSPETFRALAQSPHIQLFDYLEDGTLVNANDTFCNYHGLMKESLGTYKLSDICPRLGKHCTEGQQSNNVALIEEHDCRHTGSQRNILVIACPSKKEGSSLLEYHAIGIDITEKRKLEEYAEVSKKLEALGVLAGGIAHDLNNILCGLFAEIELAHRRCKGTGAERNLERALSVFSKAKNLADQLLTFSKGGSPRLEAKDLSKTIKNSAEFALSGSPIKLAFVSEGGPFVCEHDENQMSRVIENVVLNAKNAMPNGGALSVRVWKQPRKEKEIEDNSKDHWIHITISDTGLGIPKDIIAKVFDPFFTTSKVGNGLGLAICHSIIKKHGGDIGIESTEGKGTTVSICIPAMNEPLKSPQFTSNSNECSIAVGKKGGTLIIMDDQEYMRDALMETLSVMGYDVIPCADGKEVLQCLDRTASSIVSGVILDLTVPGGMGGKETVKHIRERGLKLPVFAVTGYTEDPCVINPAEHGFSDAITKPFQSKALSELLQRNNIGI